MKKNEAMKTELSEQASIVSKLFGKVESKESDIESLNLQLKETKKMTKALSLEVERHKEAISLISEERLQQERIVFN